MRPFLALAVLAGLVLALAACGGGLEVPESTGAADTGAAAATEEPVTETTAAEPAGEPFQITVPSSAPIGPTSPPKAVKQLQRALKLLGYNVGPIDGVWGPQTENAVKKFQRDNKLGADGLVGEKTERAINKALRDKAA